MPIIHRSIKDPQSTAATPGESPVYISLLLQETRIDLESPIPEVLGSPKVHTNNPGHVNMQMFLLVTENHVNSCLSSYTYIRFASLLLS